MARMVKVRLNTLMAGPDGVAQSGDVVTVSQQVAEALAASGSGEIVQETAAVQPAGETRELPFEADLEDLVGAGPAEALAEAGYPTVDAARAALESGEDLTEIRGVGAVTAEKLG